GHFLEEAGLLGEGVLLGAEAGDLAREVLARWPGRSLTLIDTWVAKADGSPYGSHQQESKKSACQMLAQRDKRVKLLQSDSKQAAQEWQESSLDWVYVDGDHSFRVTGPNLEAWWPKLKPGGLMAGHAYLDAFSPSNGLFGVKSAVDQ